jgi:hypothetical protein
MSYILKPRLLRPLILLPRDRFSVVLICVEEVETGTELVDIGGVRLLCVVNVVDVFVLLVVVAEVFPDIIKYSV